MTTTATTRSRFDPARVAEFEAFDSLPREERDLLNREGMPTLVYLDLIYDAMRNGLTRAKAVQIFSGLVAASPEVPSPDGNTHRPRHRRR